MAIADEKAHCNLREWPRKLYIRPLAVREFKKMDEQMRTTPQLFLKLFVRPNYADFLGSPDSIRLGFNAAVSAFQLADIFFAFYKREAPEMITAWPTKKVLLAHLSSIEPNFSTIQSVATVYKHLYAKGWHYEVGSPGSLWSLSVSKEAVELEASWQDHADVLVRRRDGTIVSLKAALCKVIEEMWPAFLPNEDKYCSD